jgi:Domain of unknown function (DUF4296)
MHKYIILFFSVTAFLSSCIGDNNSAGIIKHDRMINLLTEFHMLDGRLYSVAASPDSLYKYGNGRYAALFKKYHTDSVQFRKSYQYYTTQPTELQAMYLQIMKNLKQKSDSLGKINHLHAVSGK